MGCGLAVAQQLIEQMGGKISYTSLSGQGSCFSILIPTTQDRTTVKRLTADSNLVPASNL